MTYYGIYKITNLLNGKMYIGQHKTTNIDDGYMGSGKIIRLAIKKYGVENFRKEWLMFCEDEEELDYMERVYVDQTWVDRSDTYNLRWGGDGKIVSEDSRKKLSESLKGNHNHKGKHHSDETKKKLSVMNKGKSRPMPEDAKKKLSLANKGKHLSEATKQKLSEINKGKHHSEETKKKMSETRKAKPVWNKGKPMSEEQRMKLSMLNKGFHWYNNGVEEKQAKSCPDGFIKGRLKRLS